jgi:chemotaxis protein methyltransferase CheR
LRSGGGGRRRTPEILATDAEDVLLARAERGVYGGGSLKDLPEPLRAAAFEREGPLYRLRPSFRAPVTLRRADIRERMPQGPFDLVLCRNLIFTYFARPLQAEEAERLAGRLRLGGILVVGAHETLPPGIPGLAAEPGPPGIYRHDGGT